MLIVVNFFLFVLAAIPVCIYFYSHKDRVLSGYLLAASAIFFFSGGLFFLPLSDFDYLWLSLSLYIAAYAFHYAVWISMAIRRESIRVQILPLLSVSTLLLVYALFSGNPLTLVLTVLYTVIALRMYREKCRNKALGIGVEESPAPLEGVFREFAPQRALYINDKKKEYE